MQGVALTDRRTAQVFSAWLGVVLSVTLAACSTVPSSVAIGAADSQIAAKLGQPTARYGLPGGGQRLQYSQGPMGREVYNIDLDKQGNAVSIEQTLDESLFPQRIVPGKWTRDDVLREYGKPAHVMKVRSFQGDIWVWRYWNVVGGARFLYIDIDSNNIVRSYSTLDEPRRSEPRRKF
jgi:hypothetical protein